MDALTLLQSRIPAELDGVLVTEITNVAWLTEFSGSSGKALVTKDQAIFLTDSRYTLVATEQVKNMPSASYQSPKLEWEFIKEHLKSFQIKKLGLDGGTVTYEQWNDYSQKWPCEIVDAKAVFSGLRMIKRPDEIAKIEDACRLADACYEHVQRLMQPGVTERDISIEIEFFFKRQGAEPAFAPIVVSGERSARPHGVPSEKKLEIGDFVTMDFGARLAGYNSDITRTVVVGDASARHIAHYNAVLEAQLAALEAMKPGVRAADVDQLARQILAKHDLAQYFGHGLGHGLGRLVHDTGRMAATSSDVLSVGQVWTVEPGAYVPGFGGVRIENDVVIEENGARILDLSTKDLLVLPL
jgi:Xaa-Pro aminopeptidase